MPALLPTVTAAGISALLPVNRQEMDNYPAQSKFTIRGRYKANFLGIFSPTNIDSSQSMGCRCPKSVDNELGGWGVNMSWSGEGTKIPALSSRPLLFRGLFSGQSSGLGVMGIYPEKTIIQQTHVSQCSLQHYLQ